MLSPKQRAASKTSCRFLPRPSTGARSVRVEPGFPQGVAAAQIAELADGAVVDGIRQDRDPPIPLTEQGPEGFSARLSVKIASFLPIVNLESCTIIEL